MSSAMNLWGSRPTKRAPYHVKPADKSRQPAPSTPQPPTPESPVVQVEPPLEAGSWEKPRQVLPEVPLGDMRYGRRIYDRIPRDKRRRQAVSISVSQEEGDILRAAADAAHMSFSDWARRALFAHANRDIPARIRSEFGKPDD